MPDLHVRRPCPVCLGTMMEVVHPVAGSDLAVDRCGRCGGVWFDAGETRALREAGRNAARALWPGTADPPPGRCHECHAVLDRDAERCAACGHPNVLDCPGCTRTMQVREERGVRIDACAGCRGVWLDAAELRRLWRKGFETGSGGTAVARRMHAGDLDAWDVLDAIWITDLVTHGGIFPAVGHAAGHAVGAAGNALGNAPEAAAGLMEMLGAAASAVFEAVVGILEGLG